MINRLSAMKTVESSLKILFRTILIGHLLLELRQQSCSGVPLVSSDDGDQNRRELLAHFRPSLDDERIGQVNDLLQQLHRHAVEKRFRFAANHGRNRTKPAWDLKSSNLSSIPLRETDDGNVTVDNNTDEKSLPESSPVSAFIKKYLFEGDILLTPEQAKSILTNLVQQPNVDEKSTDSIRRRQKRTALISGDSTRWQSLPIRYDFDASIGEDDKEPIRAALEYWQTHTCIWFQYAPGVTDGDFLSFFKGNGCYSMIGKIGGKQGISIGDGCAQMGVVTHEIGHALGMWHEQSRPDSDRYIRLVPQNIIDGTLSNFLQRSWSETNSYDVSYDPGSVMHYGPTAFAVDPGRHTIETLLPGFQRTIGQREGPSFLDVSAINKAYCTGRCSQPLACQYGGYTHPSCHRCICPDGLTGTYCERPADSQNANCGGIVGVNKDWTNITSPNYPKAYGKNQRCSWILRAAPGFRVLFQFQDDFKIYCTATCYDYVEIKNSTDFSNTGMRFCCNDRPADTFYSTTNEMLVIFHSQTTNEVGFRGRATQYPQAESGVPISAGFTPENPQTSLNPSTIASTTAPATTVAATSAVSISSTTPNPTSAASSPAPTSSIGLVSTSIAASGFWGIWTDWSACSKTCGACGVKSRQRECLDGSCTGDAHQFKRCPFNICPGDTTCSKLTFLDFPCGGGGRVCSSVHEVTVKCTFPSCCTPFKPGKNQCELASSNFAFGSGSAPDGHWEPWSDWGECFGPKCGGCARQVRHRVCQDEKCKGDDREFRPCNNGVCKSCNESPLNEIVEAPCLDEKEKTRKEMCLRPKRPNEATCPCCPPLKEKNGQCL